MLWWEVGLNIWSSVWPFLAEKAKKYNNVRKTIKKNSLMCAQQGTQLQSEERSIMVITRRGEYTAPEKAPHLPPHDEDDDNSSNGGGGF
jgi:hypothetical protein